MSGDVERAGAVARASAERRTRAGWQRRTIAEQLDDAETGEEFAGVLWKLFAAWDAARVEEEDDDDDDEA